MFRNSSVFSKIFEIFVLCILSLAAVIFPQYIIVIFLISSVICTVSSCALSFKHTAIYFVVVTVFTIAVYNLLNSFSWINVYDAFVIALLNLIPGFFIGLSLKQKSNLLTTVSYGALGIIASFILEFVKLKFIFNIDITEKYINEPIQNTFDRLILMLGENGMKMESDSIELIQNNLWTIKQQVGMMLPAVLIILSLLGSFFIFLISRKLLNRFYKISFVHLPHFWELRMYKSASLMLIVIMIAMCFSSSAFAGALSNIAIILISLYIVCGLSVVDFYFKRTNIPSVARGVIYVVAVFGMLILYTKIPIINPIIILSMIGLFDTTLNFRRFGKKEV